MSGYAIRLLKTNIFNTVLRQTERYSTMATSGYLKDVLESNSTGKFFIEYNGFLSNHLAHGVIALHRLSANQDRLKRFIDWYSPRLESPAIDMKRVPDCDLESLLGKRKAYYDILSHFEHLLKTKYKDLDSLIAAEFPKLSTGMAGSALHGLIHLGYGYSVCNERIVLEGLAYTYHSYRPIVTSGPTDWEKSFGKGNVDILDALSTVAANRDIRQAMDEGAKEERFMKMSDGEFQRRLSFLLTARGDALVNYVNSLKVPASILTSQGEIDTHALARKVVYWSIVVYTLSNRKNDFFLLHGVTGSWSLLQILPVLEEQFKLKVICEFLTIFVGVYIAQSAPSMTIPLEPHTESWEELVNTALKQDVDEHCYKLVQVCHELACSPVDDENPNVLKQAALTVLNNGFYLFE